MKTRLDFVSNSSSSSFICTSSDLNTIKVYGDIDYYDVHHYIETHWHRDVFEYWGMPAESQVMFEPDKKYVANFGSNSFGTLPESAKDAYGKYKAAYVRAKTAHSKERDEALQDVKCLEKDVIDAIWVVLEPKWKDIMLAEVTAYDDNGDEESMYDSFGSLHNPVFCRTFNNH